MRALHVIARLATARRAAQRLAHGSTASVILMASVSHAAWRCQL
eukprot:CAMPEP_0183363700 /NCGR_PEP_ID=MMETSP0164_2-20130417/76448_1 /TAXON_ID=221442 /ORGANISM="Coccolithus pelagicus ssp braarudi, Strain PLY182g" /LENGTH=43 /DNA_ID= /DNA_START= /DNA_END= /DNA_ORIENTATION=